MNYLGIVRLILGIAGFIGVLVVSPSLVHASGQRPNILVLGEKNGRDAVEPRTAGFRRILSNMAKSFRDNKYVVFEREDLAHWEIAAFEDLARPIKLSSKASRLAVDREVSTPIDAVMFVSVKSNTTPTDGATLITYSISARIIYPQPYGTQSDFEIIREKVLNGPNACQGACPVILISESFSSVMPDIGPNIIVKIDDLLKRK